MTNIMVTDPRTGHQYTLSPHRDLGCVGSLLLNRLGAMLKAKYAPAVSDVFGSERLFTELLPEALEAFTKYIDSHAQSNPLPKPVEGLMSDSETWAKSGMLDLPAEKKVALAACLGMLTMRLIWQARAEAACGTSDEFVFDLSTLLDAMEK